MRMEAQKRKRSANFELLRIVAMLMVITLHYLGESGVLLPYGETTANSAIAWILEAFCYGAVNLYMLISGYFLVSGKFHLDKVVKLWLQVFFYSAGIWAIYKIGGFLPEKWDNAYYVNFCFLPITAKHYWFATNYILLYLISPFLALVARKLSKRNLQCLIGVLLFFFARIWELFLPMSYPLDDRGYGITWFVCLFFVAAYIRLHVPENKKKWPFLLTYVASSLCIGISYYAIGKLAQVTGRFEVYKDVFYEYNGPLVVLGSVALFLFFRNLDVKESKLTSFWTSVGGLTFGVFLFHEHVFLNGYWHSFWKVNQFFETPYFVLHVVGTVLAIFVVGIVIEKIRTLLFGLLYKSKPYKALQEKVFAKIDKWFEVEEG